MPKVAGALAAVKGMLSQVEEPATLPAGGKPQLLSVVAVGATAAGSRPAMSSRS